MTKITRQTQTIFAKAATNNGVIGSGQDGTKILSNSLPTLMEKPAWNTGWLDMVLGTKKFPPLEEFQALDYINTYQLSYIFQEGMPEYDAGTTYYTNSWVKKSGTNKIYGSITNANIGNALTDAANWKLLVDFDASTATDLILNYAADTGTANHFLIAPSPAGGNTTGTVIFIKPAHAITGACDVGVNGNTVKNIKLMDGTNPATGMMLTTGLYMLAYDGTNYVLMNPSLGSAAYKNTGTTAGTIPVLDTGGKYPALDGSQITNIIGLTLGASGSAILPGGLTMQWGTGVCNNSGLGAANTFGTAFSAVPYHVSFTVIASSTSAFTTGYRPSPATNTWTKTGFNALSDGGSSIAWFAIGAT